MHRKIFKYGQTIVKRFNWEKKLTYFNLIVILMEHLKICKSTKLTEHKCSQIEYRQVNVSTHKKTTK